MTTQPTNKPETCPECGAGPLEKDRPNGYFACASIPKWLGEFWQSDRCKLIVAERALATALADKERAEQKTALELRESLRQGFADCGANRFREHNPHPATSAMAAAWDYGWLLKSARLDAAAERTRAESASADAKAKGEKLVAAQAELSRLRASMDFSKVFQPDIPTIQNS